MIYAINRKTKEHLDITSLNMPFIANHIDRDLWHVVGANDDGWIKWNAKPGAECPLPKDDYCDVKHEDGFIGDRVPAANERWSGVKAPHGCRIIAYRPNLNTEPGELSELEAPEWAIGSRCLWQLGDVCMGEHTILAKDGDTYWVRDDHGGYDMADREELRPIRTPTQRAEEEAVEEMIRSAGLDNEEYNRGVCRDLYRAGYRHQAKENIT